MKLIGHVRMPYIRTLSSIKKIMILGEELFLGERHGYLQVFDIHKYALTHA